MKRVMMYSGVLALVAVALAVWLVLDQPRPKSPEEEWQPQSLVPSKVGIEEIVMVSEGANLKFVFNERYGGYVLFADGRQFATDSLHVGRLTGIILKLEKTKLISLNPPDLTIYSLKPPLMTLSVKFAGSTEKLELEIGKENYTHDALFAKLRGQPTVFLIPMDINVFIGVPANVYRSHSLSNFVATDVASIEIKIVDPALKAELATALEPKIVVQKQVKGKKPKWLIVSPINEEANFVMIDSLFNRLNTSRADEIIDAKPEQLAGFGLKPPRAMVTLTMISGQVQQVLFGRDTDKDMVYAMNNLNPEVFLISKEKRDSVLFFNGRTMTPLPEQREIQPSKVLVEYPREGLPTMELERLPEGRTFEVAGRPGLTVQMSRLRRLMRPLRGGDVVILWQREPYPREDYGLDRPRMRFQMTEGETVPVDIAFGNTATINGNLITYVEDLRRKCILIFMGDIMKDMPYGEREFTTPPKPRR